MTDLSMELILKCSDTLKPYVKIPFSNFEAFNFLSNKLELSKLAKRFNIPVPKTWSIEDFKRLPDIINDLEFPIVLKQIKSNIIVNGDYFNIGTKHIDTPRELLNIYDNMFKTIKQTKSEKLKQSMNFFIQKRINGPGSGIFIIADHGKPKIFFAHKRLREKPPSGGVSVLRESILVNSEMRNSAIKLLSYVNWHGVAMVEFKIDEITKIPYLIEINCRFWGSLQLAIDAGVDFPYLLYKLAIGESLPELNNYKINIKNRWLLGDLDHLFIRLFKSDLKLPSNYPSKLKTILDFLKFYDRNTNYEIFSLHDLKPFFYELQEYIKSCFF